jgi:anti-anti-sigma factor
MLLRVEQRQVEPDITLVEFAGKLTLGPESQLIEQLVEELAEEGRCRVIFDMSRIDYIDSAGVGLIAMASGRFKEKQGRLVIVAPPGRVQHELHVTQMDRLVTVLPSTAQAIALLGAQSTQAG